MNILQKKNQLLLLLISIILVVVLVVKNTFKKPLELQINKNTEAENNKLKVKYFFVKLENKKFVHFQNLSSKKIGLSLGTKFVLLRPNTIENLEYSKNMKYKIYLIKGENMKTLCSGLLIETSNEVFIDLNIK